MRRIGTEANVSDEVCFGNNRKAIPVEVSHHPLIIPSIKLPRTNVIPSGCPECAFPAIGELCKISLTIRFPRLQVDVVILPCTTPGRPSPAQRVLGEVIAIYYVMPPKKDVRSGYL